MSGNPYLDRKAKSIGTTGRISEKRTAKRLSAKLTPASGAAIAKGDMKLGELLIEAKSTVNGSMSLKLEWLVKIANEALMTGKTPALTVTFVDEPGKPRPNGAWVLIPESLLSGLLQSIANQGSAL